MKPRIMILALALACLAGGWSVYAQQGQTQTKAGAHMDHHQMMQACAKACSDCQRMCDMCATHCAFKVRDGEKAHFTTLQTCQDCATLCAGASEIVARGGPFSDSVCQACAEACDRCAKACEKFPDDKHMKACAEECRKCEKACKDMLKHIEAA